MARWELRIAGWGGQGILTAGYVLGRAAVLHAGWDAVLTTAYGPETRGGWARIDVVLDDDEVVYPLVDAPDLLVALSQEAVDRVGDSLRPGGVLFAEARLVQEVDLPGRTVLRIPVLDVAEDLGRRVFMGVTALGAVLGWLGILPQEALLRALLERVPRGTEEANRSAFLRGWEMGTGLHQHATPQALFPDRFPARTGSEKE